MKHISGEHFILAYFSLQFDSKVHPIKKFLMEIA